MMEASDIIKRVSHNNPILNHKVARLYRVYGLVPSIAHYAFIVFVLGGLQSIFTLRSIFGFFILALLWMNLLAYNLIADKDSDKNIRHFSDEFRYVFSNMTLNEAGSWFTFSTALLVGALLFAGNLEIIVLCGVGYFSVYLYTTPPLRLKGRPIIGNMVNVLGAVMTVLFAQAVVGGSMTQMLYLILGTAPLVFPYTVMSELKDYTNDKKAGDCTTAVWLGKKKAILLIQATLLIGLVTFSALLASITPLCLLFAPFAVFAMYKTMGLKSSTSEERMDEICFNSLMDIITGGVLVMGLYVLLGFLL